MRNYLEEYLPADVHRLLNLDSLARQEGSFIDDAMQEHQTDLLYQVQLTSGAEAYLYFLFEHKSYRFPDRFVWLTRVEDEPIGTVTFRSPRYVEDEA